MADSGITALASDTLIHANAVDYLIVFIYFGFVLAIGWMASRRVSDSLDFFPTPPWATPKA